MKKENKEKIRNVLSGAVVLVGRVAISTVKAGWEIVKEGASFLGKVFAPDVCKGYKEQKEFLMTKKQRFKKEVKDQMFKKQAEEEAKRRLGL